MKSHWVRFTAVYVIALFFWFGLWLWLGDSFWWLTMLNRVVPFLFLPAVLLFLVGLWRRSLPQIGWALLPLVLFIALYRPYLRPTQSGPGETAVVRIMTFNVLFSNAKYERVAKLIQAYEPDLVALQEVQPRMMRQLQKQLQAEYPYSVMAPRLPYGTTALFSRTPLLEQEILDLGDDRPATIVTTEIEGERITFASAHLLAYGLRWVPFRQIPQAINERTALQNIQARILLTALTTRKGTVILGCDCNTKETSATYRILSSALENAGHGNGLPIFRSALPGTKFDTNLDHIDYIFYRAKWQPIGTYVVKNQAGSDHQPLIAEFNLSNPE